MSANDINMENVEIGRVMSQLVVLQLISNINMCRNWTTAIIQTIRMP